MIKCGSARQAGFPAELYAHAFRRTVIIESLRNGRALKLDHSGKYNIPWGQTARPSSG